MTAAIAHPNFALVKYWGKRDLELNLPAVPSLSLTVDRYRSRARVVWGAEQDAVVLEGSEAPPPVARRVLDFLDLVDPGRPPCLVETSSNFPMGAGLASSSSSFAALALAATRAAGQGLSPAALSVLARRGSGSACRSLWGGFVEWQLGESPDGTDSHGVPVAGPEHWAVSLLVAVVSSERKAVGSTEGMERTRATSPLYGTWVQGGPGDVDRARQAVLGRDIEALGEVMEASTFKMHGTMHTSRPPLLYWQPDTVACLQAVFDLRRQGVGAWATMDAGPNVKVLCQPSDAHRVSKALEQHAKRVDVLGPGLGAHLEAA